MFSLPAFLGASITDGWFHDLCVICGLRLRRSPRSPSATTPRRKYVPEARRALREGRRPARAQRADRPSATRRRGRSDEGGDPRGRRGHPAASAHQQPAQADDAAGQQADARAHRRRCSRGTASTTSSSPSRTSATRSATTSATAPTSGCGCATPPRSSRSAPRGRCATRPTSSTRRSSSSRATCSPTSTSPRSSRPTARTDAAASIALKRVENPLDFGIVITRPDGSIERFLEKPTWGEVFSDTINTGIYVLEPEIFEHIPLGRGRRLLGRRVPGGARRRRHHPRPRGRGLLGGRRHHRGLPAGPRRRARRPGRGRHRGLLAGRGGLAGGGRRRSIPTRELVAPGRDRAELPGRGGRRAAGLHGARHRRRRAGRRDARAHRLPRPRVRRPFGALTRAR